MPRRDGTGPMGAGSITGRGLGICTGANAVKYGAGLGMGFAVNQTSSKTQKELLNEQKTMLQDRLKVIDKQLESL